MPTPTKRNHAPVSIASQLLAAGSGALFSASLSLSFLGILGWICFIPLLLALREEDARHALRLGIISGTSMNLVSLYWLAGTLTRFGEIPLAASVAILIVFCVYSSFQFGLFAFFISRFDLLREKTVKNALMISVAWVVSEFFFPVLFPYSIGVSQSYYPRIIQVVDTLGVNFLGFILLFANVSIFYIARSVRESKRPPLASTITSVITIAAVLGYGSLKIERVEQFLETAAVIEVGMVQANFDYAEKSLENESEITEKHRRMSRELAGADLIIWPETSVQHWFPKEETIYRTDHSRKVVPEGFSSHFLIGGLSFTEDPDMYEDGWTEEDYKKYNSAFLVDSKSNILGHYSKTRLFPFGEYFPGINDRLKFLKKVFPMMGDLTAGESLKVLEVPGKNIRIGPLICYEDIMGGISRNYAKMGANILVNLTNDAWFGKSSAPAQHLLLSIPRAVETRRYLVRATNSGISAIVSPTGKIEDRTGIFTTETLKAKIVPIDSLKTLYETVGDVFAWLCLAVTILFAAKRYLGRKYGD